MQFTSFDALLDESCPPITSTISHTSATTTTTTTTTSSTAASSLTSPANPSSATAAAAATTTAIITGAVSSAEVNNGIAASQRRADMSFGQYPVLRDVRVKSSNDIAGGGRSGERSTSVTVPTSMSQARLSGRLQNGHMTATSTSHMVMMMAPFNHRQMRKQPSGLMTLLSLPPSSASHPHQLNNSATTATSPPPPQSHIHQKQQQQAFSANNSDLKMSMSRTMPSLASPSLSGHQARIFQHNPYQRNHYSSLLISSIQHQPRTTHAASVAISSETNSTTAATQPENINNNNHSNITQRFRFVFQLV